MVSRPDDSVGDAGRCRLGDLRRANPGPGGRDGGKIGVRRRAKSGHRAPRMEPPKQPLSTCGKLR